MTRCSVCDGDGAITLLRSVDRLTGTEFEVRECGQCATAFTVPRPTNPGAFYPEDYYAYRAVRPRAWDRIRLSLIARGPYRPIARRHPGKMLDVGCGSGRLAHTFRQLGWDVVGIEPSGAGAAAARAGGMQVHHGTLDDQLPWCSGSFDAVVFNHSLEHVSNPLSALVRARDLCTDGALIGVTVPNFGSWQRRLFGKDWLQLDVPRHVTHFTRDTLHLVVEKAGLAVVKLSATSTLAGCAGSAVRKFDLPLEGRPVRLAGYASYPLVALIDLSGRGDCINLIARVP